MTPKTPISANSNARDRRRLEAVYGARASLNAHPLPQGFQVTICVPLDATPLRLQQPN